MSHDQDKFRARATEGGLICSPQRAPVLNSGPFITAARFLAAMLPPGVFYGSRAATRNSQRAPNSYIFEYPGASTL